MLRPIGTPLPLGFLALTVATFSFSAVQLSWIPVTQGRTAALAALLFSMPLQLIASVFGFCARDPVAGIGNGVLAGTWAVLSVHTLTTPPGTSSSGLGIVLFAAAAALLVPAVAGVAKVVASGVLMLASVRFAVTGVAELTASAGWKGAAGIVGLALAALALYAALGFELEDVRGRTCCRCSARAPRGPRSVATRGAGVRCRARGRGSGIRYERSRGHPRGISSPTGRRAFRRAAASARRAPRARCLYALAAQHAARQGRGGELGRPTRPAAYVFAIGTGHRSNLVTCLAGSIPRSICSIKSREHMLLPVCVSAALQ